ncbi:unnamed protein product [Closterium sp. NIES-65]|nr:unnamed protein product [Closterium sp. NIES-65]
MMALCLPVITTTRIVCLRLRTLLHHRPPAFLRLDSPPATSATTAAATMATTRAAAASRALPLLPLLALSLTAALLLSFTSPSDALGWTQMSTKYTCNPNSNYGMWFKYGCNCQAINTTELGYKKLWATCPGVNPSAYGRRAFGNVWLESVGYANWVSILMECARQPYHLSTGFNGKCSIPNILGKPYWVGGGPTPPPRANGMPWNWNPAPPYL